MTETFNESIKGEQLELFPVVAVRRKAPDGTVYYEFLRGDTFKDLSRETYHSLEPAGGDHSVPDIGDPDIKTTESDFDPRQYHDTDLWTFRNGFIRSSLKAISDANIVKGLTGTSYEFHPARKYMKEGHFNAAAASHPGKKQIAIQALRVSCGVCPLANNGSCSLAYDPQAFMEKYHTASSKKKLERRLSNNPETNCSEVDTTVKKRKR